MNRIGFVAYEAGAAAAMAPVWSRLGARALVALSPVAAHRTATTPHVPLGDDEPPPPEALAGLGALLLSATGRKAEGEVIALARSAGVPVVQIVDTWGPYAPRFAHGSADVVAVVDAAAAAEARADGLEPSRIRVTGNPAWEDCPALPAARRGRVAFLAQPVRRLYGSRLGYDEVTALGCLRALKDERPDLIDMIVVVPHPAGDDAVAGPDEETMSMPEALASCADVTGMFSSAMVDALLGGRRVASIQPGLPAEDACPLSRHGRIARCGTAGQLADALLGGVLLGAPHDAGSLRAAMAGSRDRLARLLEAAAARPGAAA